MASELNSLEMDALVSDLNTVGTQVVQDTVKKVLDIWKEVYPMHDIRALKNRLKELLENIEKAVTTVYEREEEIKNRLISEIEAKYKELDALQKELAVTINTEAIHHDESLIVMNRMLDELLSTHRQEKLERLDRLGRLREREAALCAVLEAEPIGGIPHVPTDNDFVILEDRIRWLSEEEIMRTDRYDSVRASVLEIMKAIEEEPVTDFERLVFGSEPFHLSPSNMRKLEELEETYRQKLHDATIHINLLKTTLQKLWIRIKESPENQANFLENNCGLGKSTIKAFKREIARAEEIKLANIKPVIEGLREEIAALWDHMTYSEEQRKRFDPFFSQYYSEEVMELHEIELADLQRVAASCESVLKLARQRESLLERRAHLELLSRDKTRLNNRGGQLLREEKERKALDKKFPRLEEELLRLLTEYEACYNKPFLFHGENLLEKILNEQAEREQKKVTRTNSTSSRGCKRPIQHNVVTSVNSSRVITRSQTPRSDVSTASCGSYTHFQSNLGEPTFATPKRMLMTVKTPSKIARTPVATRTPGGNRTPLRPIQPSKPTSAFRATSSPRGTPHKRSNIPAPLSASRTPRPAFF